MNKTFPSVSILSVLLLSACVTINIYFPAAAAERVADEIVHGIQDENNTAPDKQPEPQSGLEHWQQYALQGIDQLLNVLIGSAQAAGANLDVDTAEIRQLRAAMKKRFASLQDLYEKGYIGIKKNGFLSSPDASIIPLRQRNKVNRLMQAENNDRKRLYRAIANANGHPDWEQQIEATFASSWVSNARSGWWYQTANGSWKQK